MPTCPPRSTLLWACLASLLGGCSLEPAPASTTRPPAPPAVFAPDGASSEVDAPEPDVPDTGDASGVDANRTDTADLTDATELTDAFDAGDSEASTPCTVGNITWWDSRWPHRRALVLGDVPADYTVLLRIDAVDAGAMGLLPDASDLRVLRFAGAWTELDRVVEVGTNATRVYFRVAGGYVASSPDARYYLYFGRADAALPPADATRVFLFADDFERSDPGIGTQYVQIDAGAAGHWAIDSGQLIQDGVSSFTALAVQLPSPLTGGFEISYRWLGHAANPDSGPIFFWDLGARTGVYLERQQSRLVLFREMSHSNAAEQPFPASADAWRRHTLRYAAGALDFFEGADTVRIDLTGPPSLGTVGVATYESSLPFRFDDLHVRHYVAPEPTVSLADVETCQP